MDSRLEQPLVRTKSKAENFGLFALYHCYFFICCLTALWPMDNGPYQFLPQTSLGGVESLHLIESPVVFDHSSITHVATHSKLQKISLPRLAPSFSKMWKCPQSPTQL